jgi:hypothetical protein
MFTQLQILLLMCRLYQEMAAAKVFPTALPALTAWRQIGRTTEGPSQSSTIIIYPKSKCKYISKHTSIWRNIYGEKSSSVAGSTATVYVINRSNCVAEFSLPNNDDKSFMFEWPVNVDSFSLLLAAVLPEVSSEVVSSLCFSGISDMFTRKIQLIPTHIPENSNERDIYNSLLLQINVSTNGR